MARPPPASRRVASIVSFIVRPRWGRVVRGSRTPGARAPGVIHMGPRWGPFASTLSCNGVLAVAESGCTGGVLAVAEEGVPAASTYSCNGVSLILLT